ncbi:hypothetical protein LTR27_001077 [Elasticomyces elasticus]|nr:hypothetical protein LTR27_001077 [Elasticomyces elasticus]
MLGLQQLLLRMQVFLRHPLDLLECAQFSPVFLRHPLDLLECAQFRLWVVVAILAALLPLACCTPFCIRRHRKRQIAPVGTEKLVVTTAPGQPAPISITNNINIDGRGTLGRAAEEGRRADEGRGQPPADMEKSDEEKAANAAQQKAQIVGLRRSHDEMGRRRGGWDSSFLGVRFLYLDRQMNQTLLPRCQIFLEPLH